MWASDAKPLKRPVLLVCVAVALCCITPANGSFQDEYYYDDEEASLGRKISSGLDPKLGASGPGNVTVMGGGGRLRPAFEHGNFNGSAECSKLNATEKDELDYAEHKLEIIFEGVGEMVIVGAVGLMTTLLLVSAMEGCRVHWIPESLVVIAVGCALGKALDVLVWTDYFTDFDMMMLLSEVNAPLLNLVFLPIIIFESGWSLRVRDFGAQIEYILIFAVIGSGIAMMVVACLIMATSGIHGIDSWRTAGVYASLIAATDPVATLATYSSLRVDPFLNIMVFGESTINDAVAITVFRILNSDSIFKPCEGSDFEFSAEHAWQIAFGIANILFGSIFFGVFTGILYTTLIRVAHMRHSQKMETLFIVTSCYLTFALAEHVHMSGIIAVLFCSIIMGVYTQGHLSPQGYLLTSFFLKQLSSFADTGVFLLVGIDVILAKFTYMTFILPGLIMVFCLVARAVATFPLGFLSNCLKASQSKMRGVEDRERWLLLSWRHLFMMWHAGLRGGISLMLTLELGEWVDMHDGRGTRQLLINCTLIIICAFLLLFGGTTEAALKLMGVQTGVDADASYLWDKMSLGSQRWYSCLHERIFTPLLVGKGANIKVGNNNEDELWDRALHDMVQQHNGLQRTMRTQRPSIPEESDDDGTSSEQSS